MIWSLLYIVNSAFLYEGKSEFCLHNLLRSFAMYLCPGMYRRYQFFATRQPSRNGAVAEMCSGEFSAAFCCYPGSKLSTPHKWWAKLSNVYGSIWNRDNIHFI
jgi:hypothetical protein